MAARWDLLLVALAAVHAATILAVPAAPLIALGVWWNSNTIAHNFIHRPFFRARVANILFSAFESALLGIPQTLWRDRHLAHHAGVPWQWQWSRQLLAEIVVVAATWGVLVSASATLFLTVYLPGYVAGLFLCAVQGHFEHEGGTTSHYGRIYNTLCFNDGYHVEHHAYPGVHWRALPRRVAPAARVSRFPPLLRWIDAIRVLDALECVVLRWPRLQRYVVRVHRRAFCQLLPQLPPLARVAIVGGGMFPRTALVLRELLPSAEIVVFDADRQHLHTAQSMVGGGVRFRHAKFCAGDSVPGFDLVVIPLAFRGDREAVYRQPPAPAVLVHDWIWRRRGEGRWISLALFKRLNLVDCMSDIEGVCIRARSVDWPATTERAAVQIDRKIHEQSC